MNFSAVPLHSAPNRITGNLAGRFLTCIFHPISGVTVPPGNYQISGPMSNSLYGTFALLTPAGPAPGGPPSLVRWRARIGSAKAGSIRVGLTRAGSTRAGSTGG